MKPAVSLHEEQDCAYEDRRVTLKDEAPLKPETTKSQQYAIHADLMSGDHDVSNSILKTCDGLTGRFLLDVLLYLFIYWKNDVLGTEDDSTDTTT